MWSLIEYKRREMTEKSREIAGPLAAGDCLSGDTVITS